MSRYRGFSQTGFSITGALVSLGIISIAVLGVSQIIVQGARTGNRLLAQADRENVRVNMLGMLASRPSCTSALGGQPMANALPVVVKNSWNGQPYYQSGQNIGRVTINSIAWENVYELDPVTRHYIGTLKLTIQHPESSIPHENEMIINANLDANSKIIGCSGSGKSSDNQGRNIESECESRIGDLPNEICTLRTYYDGTHRVDCNAPHGVYCGNPNGGCGFCGPTTGGCDWANSHWNITTHYNTDTGRWKLSTRWGGHSDQQMFCEAGGYE